MSSARKTKMSPSEYLQFERGSQEKHIYWRGEIFGMSGAKRQHIKIAGNIHRRIHQALDDSDCEVMIADQRVKNERTGSYFYPDVVATCESPKYEDDSLDTLINPQVVIEVLSKSTESFDRGEKFLDYQRLDSLKEYVLVTQNKMSVERYTRSGDSTWEYVSAESADDVLKLNTLGVEILLSDIYAKVEFESEEDGEGELKVVEDRTPFSVPR
jgi:Uma2 family endonuclease